MAKKREQSPKVVPAEVEAILEKADSSEDWNKDEALEPTMALEAVDESDEEEAAPAPVKKSAPRPRTKRRVIEVPVEADFSADDVAEAQLKAWQEAAKVAESMSLQFAEVLNLIDEARARAQKAETQLAKISAQRGSRWGTAGLFLAIASTLLSVFSLTMSQAARQELVAYSSARETVAAPVATAPTYAPTNSYNQAPSLAVGRTDVRSKFRTRPHR